MLNSVSFTFEVLGFFFIMLAALFEKDEEKQLAALCLAAVAGIAVLIFNFPEG